MLKGSINMCYMMLIAISLSGVIHAAAAKPEQKTKAEKAVLVTPPPVGYSVVYITLNVGKGEQASEVPIPLVVAQSPFISTLFATASGEEQKTQEIDVLDPRITPSLLTKIKKIFVWLYELLTPEERRDDDAYEKLTAAGKKELVKRLVRLEIVQKLSHEEIADMLYAANYLGSSLLLDAMSWQYAGILRQIFEKSGLQAYDCGAVEPIFKKRLDEDGVPAELLPLLSQYYFLRYKEDPDNFLGIPARDRKKTTIPLETLVAYELIPGTIVVNFPNLEYDPQELSSKSKESVMSFAVGDEVREQLGVLPGFVSMKYAVRALLKLRLKGDKQLNVDLKTPRLSNKPIVDALPLKDTTTLRALVCAGAKPDEALNRGLTPGQLRILLSSPRISLEELKEYYGIQTDPPIKALFQAEIKKRQEREAKDKSVTAKGGTK